MKVRSQQSPFLIYLYLSLQKYNAKQLLPTFISLSHKYFLFYLSHLLPPLSKTADANNLPFSSLSLISLAIPLLTDTGTTHESLIQHHQPRAIISYSSSSLAGVEGLLPLALIGIWYLNVPLSLFHLDSV
ncbi:hypothetical protein CFOL_v3_17596 [Cephalotus follicularis]|uniref:Uncharacterized protein n=1 Tax=Cephalotus follicularis TaxID=3775 RepID=A0A1Q3C1H4_CEPFO|nr:hypothetical protein CFOL_v3_17596 [Cephalotus follicularis]